MNQLLGVLPEIQQAIAIPDTSGQSMALTTVTDKVQSFANVLMDELGDLASPDAATQALLFELMGALPMATPSITTASSSILPISTMFDDGNNSPETGSDLPLNVQFADSAHLISQEFIGFDTTGNVLNSMNSDSVDPDTALIGIVTGAGLSMSPAGGQGSMISSDADATIPLSVTSGASTSSEAGAINTSSVAVRASLPVDAPIFTLKQLARQEPGMAVNAHAQTYDQDAQQHHRLHELELLTSASSVLIPVRQHTAERFELTMPPMLTSPSNDVTSTNVNASPLNPVAIASPGVTTVFNVPGRSDLIVQQAPGQLGWGDVFAERVTFAVRQSLQEAEIRLNPPQLGQVDVKITMNHDQASLMFSSPHGIVREAIELSVGRLRDMLNESGFNLVNVDISDKSLAQQQSDAREQRESGKDGSRAEYRADFEIAANASEIMRGTGTRNIDYYV